MTIFRTKEYRATLKALEAKKVKGTWSEKFKCRYALDFLQEENSELQSQVKQLKCESDEAKLASESNLREVLSIAEELRTKNTEQADTVEKLKRLANTCNMAKRLSRPQAIPSFQCCTRKIGNIEKLDEAGSCSIN